MKRSFRFKWKDVIPVLISSDTFFHSFRSHVIFSNLFTHFSFRSANTWSIHSNLGVPLLFFFTGCHSTISLILFPSYPTILVFESYRSYHYIFSFLFWQLLTFNKLFVVIKCSVRFRFFFFFLVFRMFLLQHLSVKYTS